MNEESTLAEQQKEMAIVGMITAAVVHEIKTPMTLIHGYSAQLTQMVEGGEIDRARLATIGAKLEKMTTTVLGLIKSVQSLAHEVQAPTESHLVEGILSDALEICERKLQNKKVKVSVDDYDKNLKVLCHPLKMSQVLINLINNAADAIASSEKKDIVLRVKAIGEDVELSVTDSGQMSAEMGRELFKPFFTTKKKGEGTGLGLYLCRELVTRSGGTIEWDATSKNTCFKVKLPRG